MRDCSAQILVLVFLPVLIDEIPTYVRFRNTSVACNADYIEMCEAVDYAICYEAVVDPDIVVDKQKQVRIGFSAYTRVVYIWRPSLVQKCDARHQSVIEAKAVD